MPDLRPRAVRLDPKASVATPSRSRDELWQKGQSSGHVQEVEEIRVDCDGDALCYRIRQEGGACHTGYRSCFYRTIDGDVVGEQVFDPDDVYE